MFVKVLQLSAIRRRFAKNARFCRNTASRVDSCFFGIFVCLKTPRIRGLNYMTNSKSEQTLPEYCREHRRWGKPAPEREHAVRIKNYELKESSTKEISIA